MKSRRPFWSSPMFAFALEYNIAPLIWAEDYDYDVYNETSRVFDPQVLDAMPSYD